MAHGRFPATILILTVALARATATAEIKISSGEDKHPPRTDDRQVGFESGKFTPSQACGTCHQEIHAVWKENAVHGNSLNISFLAAFRRAVDRFGGNPNISCLTCHAPTTVITKDYDLKQAITREGITCDFCHSLKAVRLQTPDDPFDLEVGPIKRGLLHRPEPTAHRSVRSVLQASSLLCAGCHEYANPNGAALLTTYSEWEASPFAGESVTCQTCHMPLFQAELVRNQATRQLDRVFVNLHRFPGGHSREQLSRAVRANLTDIRRESDRALVKVELRNDGAGHRVPTGLPSRRMVLEVTARIPGGRPIRQDRIYQKSVRNASGEAILDDGAMFLEAASVREDTRIGPRESREETFDLPIARSQGADVRIRLYYDSASSVPAGTRVETDISVIDTSLARE